MGTIYRRLEPEVLVYNALPNAAQTQFDTNEIIKRIKYGAGVTYASVTVDKSNVAGAMFFTNPSIDLRLFTGFYATLNDGSKTLKVKIGAAGTGETVDTELVTNGTFTTDTTGWTNRASYEFDTFAVSDGKLSLIGDGSETPTSYAAYSDDNIALVAGALYKRSLDVVVNSGAGISAALKQSGTSGASYNAVSITSTSTNTAYLTAPLSENVVFLLYRSTNAATNVLVDNASVKKILTPSALGVLFSNPVDGGLNYSAASYTVTITKD
jgi:hypothetical protein